MQYLTEAETSFGQSAGRHKDLSTALEKTLLEWMQPANSQSTRCAALLTIAAAVCLSPPSHSQGGAEQQSGSKRFDVRDDRCWQQSSIKEVLPFALATAIVSDESQQGAADEAGKDQQSFLLARLDCLLQRDAALVNALLQALPEAVRLSRYHLSDLTNVRENKQRGDPKLAILQVDIWYGGSLEHPGT